MCGGFLHLGCVFTFGVGLLPLLIAGEIIVHWREDRRDGVHLKRWTIVATAIAVVALLAADTYYWVAVIGTA